MSMTRQYTIWCDDRRYCNGNHLLIDTGTIKQARQLARSQGWRTLPDQCPNCYHQRRA